MIADHDHIRLLQGDGDVQNGVTVWALKMDSWVLLTNSAYNG